MNCLCDGEKWEISLSESEPENTNIKLTSADAATQLDCQWAEPQLIGLQNTSLQHNLSTCVRGHEGYNRVTVVFVPLLKAQISAFAPSSNPSSI